VLDVQPAFVSAVSCIAPEFSNLIRRTLRKPKEATSIFFITDVERDGAFANSTKLVPDRRTNAVSQATTNLG